MACTAAVLLAGELVVRTFVESPSVTVPVARFEWAYPPNVRVVHSSEGYSVRRTNSRGMFDDELRVPRPARRVLLLGDSYSEALQVAKGEAFADVAERLLPGTEIVNAGISGFTMLDKTEWLEIHGAELTPDVVVIQVADANLDHVLRPAALKRLASPPVVGVFEGVKPEYGLRRAVRIVLRRSALATLCWRRLKLLGVEQRAALSRRFNESAAARKAAQSVPAGEDPRLSVVLDSLGVRNARRAPEIVYLYIPHIEYFEPGCPESRPAVTRVMEEFAARQGARFVNTSDVMRAEFLRTGQPVHGFANSVMASGHLNAAGHRVVGEALARALGGLAP